MKDLKYQSTGTNIKLFLIRERFNPSIQGVRKQFVLTYGRENNDATESSHRKCFLPRKKINNYNIEIDGRNFYD